MKVLMLPRYGPAGASSRYRLLQYVPLFQREGHTVETKALVDDTYLRELYTSGRRPAGRVALGYARRIVQSLTGQRFDAMILEQEAFPYLPIQFERLAGRRALQVFVDYDDAAYVRYEGFPGRNKIARLMSMASGVIVGNAHLAAYAEQFSKRVVVIPTVVDLARYASQRKVGPTGRIRVVWIGTPVTARFLEPLLPVFRKLQEDNPAVVFRFIGAGKGIAANGLRCEIAKWSEQSEAEMLGECDIGIMPLPDTEFTRGKCALKLIQYMACGMPVVASPVGVNREIVRHDHNGFLASSAVEWEEALSRLIGNPEIRLRMGALCRERVEREYTLERGFAKWMEVLNGVRNEASHQTRAYEETAEAAAPAH